MTRFKYVRSLKNFGKDLTISTIPMTPKFLISYTMRTPARSIKVPPIPNISTEGSISFSALATLAA